MAKYGDPKRIWDYSAVEEPYKVERVELETVSEFGSETVFLISHKPAPKKTTKPKPKTKG